MWPFQGRLATNLWPRSNSQEFQAFPGISGPSRGAFRLLHMVCFAMRHAAAPRARLTHNERSYPLVRYLTPPTASEGQVGPDHNR